jgi:dihydrofolate reductase
MKVILITVSSLDGKIAIGSNDPIKWTSKEDRKFFAQESKKAGVVIMGTKTFQLIGKPLPERLNIVYNPNPEKMHPISNLLEFTNQKPGELLKELEKRRFKKVVIMGGRTIYSLFLKEKLINEIWLTVEGVILGQGISLFEDYDYNVSTQLICCRRLGANSELLKYKVIY